MSDLILIVVLVIIIYYIIATLFLLMFLTNQIIVYNKQDEPISDKKLLRLKIMFSIYWPIVFISIIKQIRKEE